MKEKNTSQQYAIGLDIGGTGSKFGIVDHRGNILSHGTISTKKHTTVSSYLDELEFMIRPLIEKVGGPETIHGIGIGAPNANFYTGTIEDAPNLPWKGSIPLADLVRQRFGFTSAITNDANAAAVGEMMYGAARGMKDFITITLGTGVGSGIVANGHLILGHDGFAGELGHTIIVPGGRLHPSTGSKGCLESYASATGVVKTAIELLDQTTTDSKLRTYSKDEIDSKIVYECAMQNDALAKEVFAFTGKILGQALANFIMFSSPEAIILFGGLTKAGDLIMCPTKEHMEKNLLPIFRNKVKLIFSELKEADAAILGASALVWEIRD